jgi:hypothetical protein
MKLSGCSDKDVSQVADNCGSGISRKTLNKCAQTRYSLVVGEYTVSTRCKNS